MKILFIGCVESSAILLKTLIAHKKQIVGVITKSESAYNADFCSLENICHESGIDCLCVKNVNAEESIAFVKEKAPDILYCFGWSQLVKKEILDIPTMGCVGFHPAELPYNRGRHPLIWALALGLKETASSFFMMQAEADAGDVISQEKIVIEQQDDAESLYHKIMQKAQKQVVSFTDAFEKGTIQYIHQELDKGNIWRKRGKEDGKIDWRMSVEAICNLVRALTKPYIGAHFEWGDYEVKIWKAERAEWNSFVENIEPGKVLGVVSDTEYYIKAYDGVVHVMNSDSIKLKEGEYL